MSDARALIAHGSTCPRLDLIMTPGFVSPLDQSWEGPAFAHQLERLTSFCRLIRFDERGIFDRNGIPGTWPLFPVH